MAPTTKAPPSSERIGLRGTDRRSVWGWCLFDWANSPFATVIVTFVFSAYFVRAVAASPAEGTSQWGWASGGAGILIATRAPVLGGWADRSGRRKPWLAICSLVCIVATALLWRVRPQVSDVPWALGCFGVAVVGYELATVFYNAMLPDVASAKRLGRISGWAWGLGYVGGLCALTVALYGLVLASPPPFGLEATHGEPVRASAVLVAGWYALFSVPLFLWCPDRGSLRGMVRPVPRGAGARIRHLWDLLRSQPTVWRFLLARMLYSDGLNTLFAFGGVYAAGAFDMSLSQVIQLGIALNVAAGIGAFAFGWLDDAWGARTTILLSLAAVILLSVCLLVVRSTTAFWLLAVPMGMFFGPAQSASRSMMARLSSPENRNELFGLFAVSGKATSFVGPMVLATVTSVTGSQRAGMATVVVFLVVGALTLWSIPKRQADD